MWNIVIPILSKIIFCSNPEIKNISLSIKKKKLFSQEIWGMFSNLKKYYNLRSKGWPFNIDECL